MPAVVSDASVIRTPSHSQATGNRSQAGVDQASSPFSELLDSCEAAEEPAPASTSKPVESARTEAEAAEGALPETAPQEGKTDKSEDPAKTAEGKDAAEVSAELALVIAAAGQQPAPQGKEGKEGQPTAGVSPDEVVSDEPQSDADAQADVPQADSAAATDAPDVQVVVPPAPAPVATPVPSAVPAIAEAAAVVADEPVLAAPMAAEVKPAVTPVITPANSEAVAKAGKAGGKLPGEAAAPTAPANKEGAGPAEQVTAAKTETASDSEAATAHVPGPAADVDAGQKPATRSTDAAANAARSDADTPSLKPGMTAAQALPDTAANSATLSPPTVVHTATPSVAQPSAQHQPLSNETVPVAGLAVEIAANAHNGKNRFEIRLDPPELGRIDVQLHIDGEGQVTSHLRVERPETLDLLRRDAPSLERALQQAGLKTSDSGLQFSLRDQSFSQHNQGRDTPAVARIVVPDEKLAPIDTQRHYGRLAGTGGGVDIRI